MALPPSLIILHILSGLSDGTLFVEFPLPGAKNSSLFGDLLAGLQDLFI